MEIRALSEPSYSLQWIANIFQVFIFFKFRPSDLQLSTLFPGL